MNRGKSEMRNSVNKFNDEQEKYFWIFRNGKLESTNCKGKGKLLYKNYKSKLIISERNRKQEDHHKKIKINNINQ